jgi:cbb3-type cytochrome c oxidase subunit II
MDRLKNVILLAGLACFALAFVLSGVYPYLITDARRAEATIADLARDVSPDFKALKEAYPVAFDRAFERATEAKTDQELLALPADDPRRTQSEEAWRAAYGHAIRRGRDIYIREVCWHCHSQYVRPVANETQRFGPVRSAAHDNNALQRPMLWGTRRVGPDLTHEGGLRSNDWHVAHFWDPKSTSPGSVMPRFPWLFETGWAVARRIDPETADREGLPADRLYRLPGVWLTRAEAEAALQRAREATPEALEKEKDRLVVVEARGPNVGGLALIAYLQWLGTWSPKAPSQN